MSRKQLPTSSLIIVMAALSFGVLPRSVRADEAGLLRLYNNSHLKEVLTGLNYIDWGPPSDRVSLGNRIIRIWNSDLPKPPPDAPVYYSCVACGISPGPEYYSGWKYDPVGPECFCGHYYYIEIKPLDAFKPVNSYIKLITFWQIAPSGESQPSIERVYRFKIAATNPRLKEDDYQRLRSIIPRDTSRSTFRVRGYSAVFGVRG